MDDVTKRVVTAAEAWLDYLVARGKRDSIVDPAEELADAVEAYRKANRPLMERLADLQKGAKVRSRGGTESVVLANVPERCILIVEDGPDDWCWHGYSSIAAILSEGPNP